MQSNETVRRGPKPNPHTRENLIRAGMDMVHAAGYAATGVKEIVDAASVPKGSFYNHFSSKEAFCKEVVDYYFETGVEDIRSLLQDPSRAPIDRLKTFFEVKIAAYKSQDFARGCLMGNLSLEVADHSDLVRHSLQAHFRTWSSLIEVCIEEARSAGDISTKLSASALSNFALNSWEGALLRMRSEKSAAPLDEYVQVLFGAVLV